MILINSIKVNKRESEGKKNSLTGLLYFDLS